MLNTLLGDLIAKHSSGETLTVDHILSRIDDLEQDLTVIQTWAVASTICTIGEWRKGVARAKRNRTLIKVLGSVPNNPLDFVKMYAAARAMTVKYNGNMTMTDPVGTGITYVEQSRFARLCRIAATNLGLEYSHQSMLDATDEFLDRAKAHRRVAIMTTLAFDPDAVFDWIALAEASCDLADPYTGERDPHFAAAMMKHFVWQAKRKQAGLPITNHLMLIFGGPQGVGKSTFAKALFSPVNELARAANFRQITDERVIEIWRAAAIFMDEMSFASKTDADEVKNVITADWVDRRPMRSNGYDAIQQMATFIGTTNKILAQLIRDETGVRRFGFIPFSTTPNRDMINAADWVAAWRSVDENGPEPIAPYLERLRDQQEDSRQRSTVEQWIDELDDRHRLAYHNNGLMARTILFDGYRDFEDRAGVADRERLNLQSFTSELKRLASSTASPVFVFEKTRDRNGWRYNGPVPDTNPALAKLALVRA